MTTGKNIALPRRTIVGKGMSLIFNMLSRLVTAFLPRSKCLVISWLQSPSAVILEPKRIKSVTEAKSIREEREGLLMVLVQSWVTDVMIVECLRSINRVLQGLKIFSDKYFSP